MKRTASILFLLLIYCSAYSQQPTSGEIYEGIRKLNVLGTVLYVAAHPDDENTRLLTYFTKDKLYRTGYLSLTRGDGGQNLIGNEQGIALGLIRTQELLSARRIDGAEQFFTRAYDFGFSKNPEETFTKWDKEKILGDVVWVIRKFQPDVIITRFPVTGEGGHGHHTASAILANEAFTAAADPKKFPDQLKFVKPWKATRILMNGFSFGAVSTERPDQFRVDVGGYNAVIGKSYGEIAAESRSQHKSQGFGVASGRGEAFESFATTGGKAPSKDLFDDIQTTWKKVEGGEAVSAEIQKAIDGYNFLQPQKSIPQLVQVYKLLKSVPRSSWTEKKMQEVSALITSCSGLWVDAISNVQNGVQGDSIRISTSLNNRLGADITLKGLSVGSFDTSFTTPLSSNKNFLLSKTVLIPADKEISQPYWLKEKMEDGMFTISDQQMIGQPDINIPYHVSLSLVINGLDITLTKPVQYKYTHPVRGEIYQPLSIIPQVTIASNPDLVVFKKGESDSKEVDLQLFANKKMNTPMVVELRSDNNLYSKNDSVVSLAGYKKNYAFPIRSKDLKADMETVKGFAKYKAGREDGIASLDMVSINYDHIPDIRYFFSDQVKVINMDLKTVGKKIGYIPGAGDKIPEALEQMGYDVNMLSDKELSQNKLSQYNTIITGVRAYNTNERMNSYYDKLMKYVEEGGNLVVQYNTSNQLGPLRVRMSPYPFNISRNRVTDENAAISFLKPEHPVLNFPNKIGQDDFKGWVQERSIYHAAAADPHFESILGMSDRGETSDNGSLIIAKHGKGYFTYTGLVFFRELP
ncbi:MAG TPA: PIG-L family deacetylase, partial [Chitinophagaceae bacterium]|nr:PIG-L family deacetylase [Chitinophagaceae bacterium]